MTNHQTLLSPEFLSKYKNKQPNWGFNGLGYIVYKRTYARLKEDGTTEEWNETVERCINGAQKIGAKYTKEEAERIYDYVFNLKCNFAGRMLWQLGTSTVDRFGANSLLNCFKYSTKVLTRQGWKQIGDLAGKEVEIVTKNGKWVTAPFKSYGKQKLMKTVFADKNGNETVIHSTPEHRWFILDRNHNSIETLTKNLKNGDKVPVVRGKNSSKEMSPQGIQHGLVFGDGSCNGYESHIDLIDNTFDECAKYFSLNRISWTNTENIRHVRYAGMPNYYKQLPDINENKQYLSGFLAGWIAADGSVNKNNGRIRLFNYRKETLDFARDIAAILGYRTSEPYLERDHNPFDSECESSELWSITFYNSDNPHHLIIRNDHRSKLDDFERNYNNWAKIISNEITDLEEEVYCAEVPDTHSFVIEGNILTGNCWATAMREPKAFLFLFENLMLGGGVGYSIRREDVHELPKIKKSVNVVHEATKDADYIVPDKREGWVNLLSKVLDAFYVTGKSFSYSTILIRGYGESIKGFGGKASGPQILIDGIDKITKIFQAREGKKLRSIDVLDICNIIGSIVVAGNVRRCLPEGAMVHSENGLIPIQNIVVGDNVLTSYGYRKVKNIFNQGIQDTVIIKTQDGEFECTPNHKMAVLNSIEEYDWIAASDLKSGDRLISTRKLIHGSKQYLPSWTYEKPLNSTTCQDITIPELDNDMAWFIGLFHGDGYVYANKKDNGSNAYVSLVFGESEYEIAEKAKSQLERFGVNNVVLKHRTDENSWQVSCASKQLAYYLHDNIKQPKTAIRVPEFINKAEYDIRLSYICGVFDSDGCSKHRPVNIVTTVYENFAKDIQNLLYSCGIESRFERCGNPPSRIGWQELFKINLITNYSKYKVSQSGFSLKEMLIGSKSQNSNSYLSSWIEHHRRETGASSGQNVTVDTYSRYSQIPQEFIPVEVISISMGRTVNTYDIEVDEVHEFYCNGYLTHNSAEIALGDPDDILYLRAKNWGTGNVPNWRAMSNNTIYADSYDHVLEEVWKNGYEINKDSGYANGEPYGFFNLPLSQKFGRIKDGPISENSLYPTDVDNCEMTNPCAEISLSNYECCNLSELYLNNITSKDELIDCAKLLYKTQKAIAALPFIHEETNRIVHKNMRLGLGVTGVCQSLDKLDWLDDCYIALRNFDKEWSAKRGWSESIKLTTIKPSGTLSLLGGATPGVHPAFSQYYMRTVRMSSADPLVQTCKDMGYHVEFLINFDGTEKRDTVVVYFPCKTPEGSILTKDMDVIKQLDMVKKLQTIWSDNAVSVTAYYKPEELESLKVWLKDNYENNIKSVSFLLFKDHGFKQAPYQEIDEATYLSANSKVKPLTSISMGSAEMLDMAECSSGACPIR